MPELDFLAPAQSPDELGRLGSYRVLKVLGQGGMGMVFKAEDPQLERMVALKVMLPEIAQKKVARERFLREARAAAKLEHDHIIPIFQVGEDRGIPYIAMPFLKGMSVDDWLKKKGRFTIPQVLRLGREIAKGLAAAHDRGLVHRDIKPANLWLDATAQGRIKILDFGLARAAQDDTQLTQEGAIVGTPAYMAPEQATGGAIDARSDLFSLGAVLYLLSTGQKPFPGNSTLQVLSNLAMLTPKPVRELNPETPPAFADLVMKLLEKSPENRPATAKSVAEAILAVERERLRAGNPNVTTAKSIATPSQIIKPEHTADESTDSFLDEREFRDKTQEDEPVRKKKPKKKKPTGIPLAVWLGVGGIAAVALIVVMVLAFRPRTEPKEIAQEDKKKPGKPPTPIIKPIEPKEKLPAPGANYALEFNGTSSYVLAPNLGNSEFGPVTLEGWTKPTMRQYGTSIVCATGPYRVQFGRHLNNWTTDDRHVNGGMPNSVVPGKWTHLAAVFDEQHIRLFIDGKQAYKTLRPDASTRLDWKPAFWIGGMFGQGIQEGKKWFYEGQIDEVRFSKGARYLSDFVPQRRLAADADTLALYHFDENQGTVLKDASGKGHDGKIVDAKWVPVLESSPPSVPEPPGRQIVLFDGTSLAGWKSTPGGSWRVENGEIIATHQGKPEWGNDLFFDRPVPRDFEIAFEAFCKNAADAQPTLSYRMDGKRGVGLRVAGMPGRMFFFDEKGPGALLYNAPKQTDLNAYQKFVLRVVGKRVTLHLNDALVSDKEHPILPEGDRLEWGLSPNCPEMRIRNIKCFDLTKPTGIVASQLFNGKDLGAWKGDPKYWQVENGAIVGRNVDKSPLVTLAHPVDFRDFRLSFQIQTELFEPAKPGYGPALYFRNDGNSGILHPSGEFDLLSEWIAKRRTMLASQTTPVRAKLDAPGYHHIELTAVGKQITILVDGLRAFAGPCPTIPEAGNFYLAMGKNSKEIRIRDVRIEELKSPSTDGWRPAFAKQEGTVATSFVGSGKTAEYVWKVREGEPVLSGTGFGHITVSKVPNHLWGNFQVRLEYRFVDTNNLAMNVGFFRSVSFLIWRMAPDGKSTLTGFSKGDDWADPGEIRSGKIVAKPGEPALEFRKHFHQSLKVLPPPGWNRLELTCLGNSFVQRLNGDIVGVYANVRTKQPDGSFKPLDTGTVTLAADGGEVEFRRIEVRDITELPAELTKFGPWKSLFNGKDLTGWHRNDLRDPGKVDTIAEDGQSVLRLTPKFGVNTIEQFQDCHFRCEFKVDNDSRGGVNVVIGGGIQILARLDRLNRATNPTIAVFGFGITGLEAKFQDGRFLPFGDSLRKKEAWEVSNFTLNPVSPWQRFEAIRFGDSVLFLLNGKVVTVLTNLRDVRTAAEKPIGKSSINLFADGAGFGKFRNIEVREITALPAEVVEAAGR